MLLAWLQLSCSGNAIVSLYSLLFRIMTKINWLAFILEYIKPQNEHGRKAISQQQQQQQQQQNNNNKTTTTTTTK